MQYRLALEAKKDLKRIFRYTKRNYGIDQARSYAHDFEDIFHLLTENPKAGSQCHDIQSGLRSFIKNKHVIFYREMEKGIRIVRILHGSSDVMQYFED